MTQIFVFFAVSLLAGALSDEKSLIERELKDAIKAKEKFIENASHYFLNPITVAMGYIGILITECKSKNAKKHAEKIRDALDRIEEAVMNTIEGKIYERKGDTSIKHPKQSQS